MWWIRTLYIIFYILCSTVPHLTTYANSVSARNCNLFDTMQYKSYIVFDLKLLCRENVQFLILLLLHIFIIFLFLFFLGWIRKSPHTHQGRNYMGGGFRFNSHCFSAILPLVQNKWEETDLTLWFFRSIVVYSRINCVFCFAWDAFAVDYVVGLMST